MFAVPDARPLEPATMLRHSLDERQRTLETLANDCALIVRSRASFAFKAGALRGLHRAMSEHFAFETRLAADRGGLSAEHRVDHARFLKDFGTRLAGATSDVGLALAMAHYFSWVRQHAASFDRDFDEANRRAVVRAA